MYFHYREKKFHKNFRGVLLAADELNKIQPDGIDLKWARLSNGPYENRSRMRLKLDKLKNYFISPVTATG